MTGSYELHDLDHDYVGQLYEGKLVIDKTYGHAAYGCGSCCGYDAVQLSPDPFSGPLGIENDDYIYANDTCAGDQEDVTGDGYSWASSDTAVATLSTRTLHTVAVGSATGSTLVQLQRANPPHCPVTVFGPQQSVQVSNGIVLQQNWGECIANDPAKGQLTMSVQWMNSAKTCLWTGTDCRRGGLFLHSDGLACDSDVRTKCHEQGLRVADDHS